MNPPLPLPPRPPEFRLLGSMHIQVGGAVVTAPAAKPSAILAVLLLQAGEFVSTEEIAERVWGDETQVSDGTIHGYVAQLRSLLKSVDTTITTGPEGYRVDVEPVRVDVHLFRRLVAGARTRPEAARECLDHALALWRGVPFPGTPCAWLRDCRADLIEERRDASHRRNVAWMDAGRHEELLEDLRVLVRRYPHDDRLAADYMMCLYRSGYVGEALGFYRGFHKRLGHAQGRLPAEMLRQLNLRMVRQDESLDPDAPGAAAVTTPQLLTPAVTSLVGRGTQLGTARAHLRATGRSSIGVVCVVGPAGIGKTAFALALAHRVRRGLAGGTLQADLGDVPGGGPGPVLDAFLAALGVLPARIPADLAGKVALYRTLVAPRPLLVLLDGATGRDDILPLLPTAPGSVMIITARTPLPALASAATVTLGPLPDGDAVALLRQVAGAPDGTDPALLARVAARCGGVPLAVCVAGARLAASPPPTWPAIEAELAATVPAAGPDDGAAAAVRRVLDWTYRGLPGPQAALFRLLGAYPGTDIDAGAAAALAGTDPSEAAALLAGLAAVRLLDEDGAGHYTVPAGPRRYAARLLDADGADREAAFARLCDHHLATARKAVNTVWADWMPPIDVQVPVPDFADRDAAVGWLDEQRANLLAVAIAQRAAGHPRHAVDLARTLFRYLDQGGHLADGVRLGETAVAAAGTSGDGPGQANALVQLSMMLIRQADYATAQQRLDQALGIYAAHADQRGMARALVSLGRIDTHRAAYQEAKSKSMRALALYREENVPLAAARTLINLGRVCELADEPDEAMRHYEEVLEVEAGLDPRVPDLRARAWGSIANLHEAAGRYAEAEDLFNRALAIFRDVHEQVGFATTLTNLGRLRRATGAYRAAVDLHEQALAEFRAIGDHSNEIEVLNDLGTALLACGRADQALSRHTEALRMALAAGEHREIVAAHVGIAAARLAIGAVEGDLDAVDRHIAAARVACKVLGIADPERLSAVAAKLDQRRRRG